MWSKIRLNVVHGLFIYVQLMFIWFYKIIIFLYYKITLKMAKGSRNFVLWNHINIWLLPHVQLAGNKLNVSISRNIYIKFLYNYTPPPLFLSQKWSLIFRWSNYSYNFQFLTWKWAWNTCSLVHSRDCCLLFYRQSWQNNRKLLQRYLARRRRNVIKVRRLWLPLWPRRGSKTHWEQKILWVLWIWCR